MLFTPCTRITNDNSFAYTRKIDWYVTDEPNQTSFFATFYGWKTRMERHSAGPCGLACIYPWYVFCVLFQYLLAHRCSPIRDCAYAVTTDYDVVFEWDDLPRRLCAYLARLGFSLRVGTEKGGIWNPTQLYPLANMVGRYMGGSGQLVILSRIARPGEECSSERFGDCRIYREHHLGVANLNGEESMEPLPGLVVPALVWGTRIAGLDSGCYSWAIRNRGRILSSLDGLFDMVCGQTLSLTYSNFHNLPVCSLLGLSGLPLEENWAGLPVDSDEDLPAAPEPAVDDD